MRLQGISGVPREPKIIRLTSAARLIYLRSRKLNCTSNALGETKVERERERE